MMNPGPGQERGGDRRRLAGQTGSSQVLYMCKCVEFNWLCMYVLCR